jgi:hypothetical protein
MPLTLGMLPPLRSNIDIGETAAIASPEWFGDGKQSHRHESSRTRFSTFSQAVA